MGRWWEHRRGCQIAAGLVSAVIGYLLLWSPDSWAHRASYDALATARPRTPVTNAVIVQLDEESRTRLGIAVNQPWSREALAQLLDRLTEAEATAVVLDLVLLENRWNSTESDAALAQAIARNGRVILATGQFRVAGQTNRDPAFELPALEFRRAAGRRFGHTELPVSVDGVVRRHPANYAEVNSNKVSLAWRTANFLGTATTNTPLPAAHAAGERWVNYYGPPGQIASTPFFAALNTNLTSDDFFRNRLVLVGTDASARYSGERAETFRSPSFWPRPAAAPALSSTEVQATLVLNLIRGDGWRSLPRWAELGLLPLLGALAAVVGLSLRSVWWNALTLAFVGMATAGLLISGHLWLPWLVPLLQIGAVLPLRWLVSAGTAPRQCTTPGEAIAPSETGPDWSAHFSAAMCARLAPVLASEPARLKPDRHEVTMLCSELPGFEDAINPVAGAELSQAIASYRQRSLAEAIFPTDGTFIRFTGDGLFALWNAPEDQADHVVRACRAALALRDKIRLDFGLLVLSPRIALHLGEVTVGDFGQLTRPDYTALGEQVRLASRLNELNRCLETGIVLTAAVQKRIGDSFATRYLGEFAVKGFAQPVEIHELLGEKGTAAAASELHAEFAQALVALQTGDRLVAACGFDALATRWPQDGPTRYYQKTTAELAIQEVTAGQPARVLETAEAG